MDLIVFLTRGERFCKLNECNYSELSAYMRKILNNYVTIQNPL